MWGLGFRYKPGYLELREPRQGGEARELQGRGASGTAGQGGLRQAQLQAPEPGERGEGGEGADGGAEDAARGGLHGARGGERRQVGDGEGRGWRGGGMLK